MATTQRLQRKQPAERAWLSRLLPERYHDVALCLLIWLAIWVFLAPVIFGGGIFPASDNIASWSFRPYLEAARREGSFPQWIPYIFSGMPSFASLLITGTRWWDVLMQLTVGLTQLVGELLKSDAARVSCFYIGYGIGMYWLLRVRGHERLVSLWGALAAVFSTFVIAWIMIGHNTKPWALMTLPYGLLLLEQLQRRFTLLRLALLVVVLHVMLLSSHLQMIFYLGLLYAFYVLAGVAVRAVRRESVLGSIRAAVALAIAGVVAFGLSADRYLSTLEYTPYSTRGSLPIHLDSAQRAKAAEGGLDYEYATNWSFSPQEMITFLVPNFFGFGKLEYEGPLSNNRPVMLHTYWGQMPFTDAANYMGIAVLVLAFLGAWRLRRDPFGIALMASALVGLFLSFGKNFPVLFDLFFYHVPLFNKFRAPSMALVLVQVAVPILGAVGLSTVLQWRQRPEPAMRTFFRWAFAGLAAWLLIGVVVWAFFEQSYVEAVAQSTTGKQYPPAIHTFIWQEMIGDWFMTALLGLATLGVLWWYVRGRLSTDTAGVLLVGLLLWDLWRVALRPMEVEYRKPEETVFRRTDVIEFLQQQRGLFRIADLTSSVPNASAYWFLENIHGYHAAKLRVYQDLLDVAGEGNGNVVLNPFLWNLLNVRFVLSPQPLQVETLRLAFRSQQTGTYVYENTAFLPRAFFVDTVVVLPPLQILERLRRGDFDPRRLVFVEQPLPQPIEPAGEGATAEVLVHKNEYIKLRVTATGHNFLFLSEIVYPPAWHATVDGRPAPIVKTNYAFRGIIVPPGTHTVELRYHSAAFERGRWVSLGLNGMVLLALVLGAWGEYRRRRTAVQDQKG
ncbi:MAG: YfhO family protein [Candidatus Kapabacteria bacterium]|nr:YfhO family protein [Candidatus Kapabacteria bacterium]MDW8012872.1 YfhO family protein [Bacteroidota bacterium]